MVVAGILIVIISALFAFPIIMGFLDSHTFPYSNHKDAVSSYHLTATLSFKDFLTYFKLAPQEWNIYSFKCNHKAEDGENINIFFSRKDFRKYRKWYKAYTDPKNKGQAALLTQVQEDIDTAKKKIAKEKKKAEDEIQKVVRRMGVSRDGY